MSVVLNQAQIKALIPHSRSMALLHEVVEVSESHIRCQATNHRSATNPLRDEEGLAAVNLVEYAAQAAAVHGPCWELQAEGVSSESVSPSGGGFVAGLKGVQLGDVSDISTVESTLDIEVRKLLQNTEGLIYQFNVTSGCGVFLASGRLTVMFQP